MSGTHVFGKLKTLVAHPYAQGTRRFLKMVVVICAIILAVAIVVTLTADLGPLLRAQAERGASGYLRRPVHIGRLSVSLLTGRYVLEDFVIEGLTPESRPFLRAGRIEVSMRWDTLKDRRVVF